MKKIIAVCLSLFIASGLFAASKTFILGMGESAYIESSAGIKQVTPATVISFEEWTNTGSPIALWLHANAGFPKTIYILPENTSNYEKVFLDKGFLVNGSIGVGLNMDMGKYTVNFGAGPHVNAHFYEIIESWTTNSGEYSMTAGISATVESRFKMGRYLFLTAGIPVSYDIWKINNSSVSDYRRISVAPFVGIGLNR